MATKAKDNLAKDQIKVWFDEVVAALRVDELSLETKTAPKDKEAFYNLLMDGKPDQLYHMMRIQSTQYFIVNLLKSFFKLIDSLPKKPKKLALDVSEAEILVWVEVPEGDEAIEDELLTIQAKINAEFYSYGFYISSTIVEESDKIEIPKHYIAAIN